MLKVKVKQDCYYKGKWYFKGEIANVEKETINAIGSIMFEVIEEVKQDAPKQDAPKAEIQKESKKEISNKKLKDINTK